jgi:hypothetical protein
VIIQQPSLRENASDDANMQEVATKRLGEETDMNAVSITISDSQAVFDWNRLFGGDKSEG